VVLAIAAFAIGLAPVLNIFPITEVSAERFLYFPSLGFCLVVAWGAVAAMGRHRNTSLILLALLLIAYSARTVTRNRDWRDEPTLFRKTAQVATDVHRVHLNLGNVHYRAGRFHEALAEYNKAVELNPDDARVWSGMAGAYKALGRLDEAFRAIERALSIDPGNASLYNNLGMLHVERRDMDAAIAAFRRALDYQPRHGRARFNLGLALYKNGDYQSAVDALTALEHKDIDHVHAYYYLAAAESKLGHRDRASAYAERFLGLYDRADAFRSNAQEIMAGRPPRAE
jgi:Flp pilus assembly protein TadD